MQCRGTTRWTVNGIAKPVRRAFELLHRYAGDQLLPVNVTASTNSSTDSSDSGNSNTSNYLSVFATPTSSNGTGGSSGGGGGGAGVTVFLSTWDLRNGYNPPSQPKANDTGCPLTRPDGCLRHITLTVPLTPLLEIGGSNSSSSRSSSAPTARDISAILHRIDTEHANPRALWEQMGSPPVHSQTDQRTKPKFRLTKVAR
jgi:hypothetical protein